MIASLSGTLFHKEPTHLIVDVNGVGYAVLVSGRTYDQLPECSEAVFLFIHTSVREDAITLYGFSEQEEKKIFLLLNTVSGVGPKLALAILSGIGVKELCEALHRKDLGRLTALSGVGKKTAQRLCVELGEKVGVFSETDFAVGAETAVGTMVEGFAMQDAASALMNLGYPQNIAWRALRAVQQQDPEATAAMKVEELIRRALQALA